ncbi:MAG TPA: class I SAM-dependent methyltransferase [Lutibacter sp.]
MNIEEQKDFYDRFWLQNNKLNSLKLRRSIKILTYFVKVKKEFKDPTVLDLGCGEGRLTAFIGEFGFVEGIELSQNAVERANKLYPHVNYLQGDVLTHNFGEKKFDVVISQEVIEHIEEIEQYIDVCHKVLNKGGYLILTTPNKKVLESMKEGSKWSNQPIEKVVTPASLKKLVSNKFRILNYDSIVFNFGDKGYFKIINSRYVIGVINRMGLRKTREAILGKLGFGLHQCIFAKKDE